MNISYKILLPHIFVDYIINNISILLQHISLTGTFVYYVFILLLIKYIIYAFL